MTPNNIKKIFEALEKHNPEPKTELVYHSEFELLIAVMLSAQATDISVNKATKLLYPIANTPKKILALGEAGLGQYIKTINFYPTKTKNILKTCEILIKEHKSQVPQTREGLEALPGVGRKTANVVLNSAFGHHAIAVDTHIFRVANRTGLAKAKTPLLVEQQLLQITPKKYLKNAHHWLVLHGRYVCKARKPECAHCTINAYCEYEDKLY